MVANIGRDDLRTRMDRGGPPHPPRSAGPSVLPALSLARSVEPSPPGKVAEMAPDLLPDKNAEIVLYCWDAA